MIVGYGPRTGATLSLGTGKYSSTLSEGHFAEVWLRLSFG
jgi:hypothetical protein